MPQEMITVRRAMSAGNVVLTTTRAAICTINPAESYSAFHEIHHGLKAPEIKDTKGASPGINPGVFRLSHLTCTMSSSRVMGRHL
jgi:uncharacterized protein (DUF1786 family)